MILLACVCMWMSVCIHVCGGGWVCTFITCVYRGIVSDHVPPHIRSTWCIQMCTFISAYRHDVFMCIHILQCANMMHACVSLYACSVLCAAHIRATWCIHICTCIPGYRHDAFVCIHIYCSVLICPTWCVYVHFNCNVLIWCMHVCLYIFSVYCVLPIFVVVAQLLSSEIKRQD